MRNDTPEPPGDPRLGTGRRQVLAMLVPADEDTPVGLVRLAASSVAFSDAIGGGLLDDALGCDDYTILLDEHRVPKDMPGNQRAALLADLRGDALVVGSGPDGTDTDLPAAVIDAAARSGLIGPDDRPDDRPNTCRDAGGGR